MALSESGMHRAGLAFVYRIIPVLVATTLYGIYIAVLCMATRGLMQRGLKRRSNALILAVLYVVFLLTTALWGLEVAQLFGLVDLLLSPRGLSDDALFYRFYDLIARETKVTGILFLCQMIVGDILVMWRASAIWFDRKVVMLLPLFWWGLLVVDTIVQGAFCQSGVSSTDYTRLCKVTNVSGPILSILTNLSVMVLVAWKIWLLRDLIKIVWSKREDNKLFTVFVLLIESGALYVVMLISDLFITSFASGGNESVGRMVDCISGYATVQFVGIYPTLMLVVLRESVWNAPSSDAYALSVTTVQFAARPSPAADVERGHTTCYDPAHISSRPSVDFSIDEQSLQPEMKNFDLIIPEKDEL